MRVLFLLLLLANLAFFAWAQWIAPSSAALPAASTAIEVPRILLAGESSANFAVDEAPAAPPAANGAATGEPPGAGSVAGAALPPGSEPGRCVSIGPLGDLDTAARVTRMLAELGYVPRQRPADGLVVSGYVVMVGGLAGPEEQARVQRRLERGGLTDAAALPARAASATDPAAAATDYAVSAGLFSERRRAERRAELVRSIGLTPTIEERRGQGTVYWLDLELRSPAEPAALEAVGLADGSLQIVPCPQPGPAAAAIR